MIYFFALLFAPDAVLWHDPGKVETVDFSRPAGGADCPVAPFIFVEESFSGMSAKVIVRDTSGTSWQVKGGPEARADAFSTRLVGAIGYHAETICFLAEGRIESINTKLKRASGFIRPDGTFTWAGFERRDPSLQFLEKEQWTWPRNPFSGTKELDGLKVLVMLLSNWDNKDARNNWQGSNTGVLKDAGGKRIYFVTDWGQTMGSWARVLLGKPWQCTPYREQTSVFVQGVSGDRVKFGFRGQHTKGFSNSISVESVRWLMQYLGRVTDAQIRTGLLASGASREEEDCFTAALRARLEQLRRITVNGQQAALR